MLRPDLQISYGSWRLVILKEKNKDPKLLIRTTLSTIRIRPPPPKLSRACFASGPLPSKRVRTGADSRWSERIPAPPRGWSNGPSDHRGVPGLPQSTYRLTLTGHPDGRMVLVPFIHIWMKRTLDWRVSDPTFRRTSSLARRRSPRNRDT